MSEFLSKEEVVASFEIVKKFIQENCLVIPDPEVQYAQDTPKGYFPSKLTNPSRGLKHLFLPRRVMYNPDTALLCSYIFMNTLDTYVREGVLPEEFQLGGVEASSIPILSQIQALSHVMDGNIAYNNNVNVFTVRKTRKNYGVFNFVNGSPKKGLPVVFIDDLINSGSSFRFFEKVATEELGLKVYHDIFCIITQRKSRPFILQTEKNEYSAYSIFIGSDFDYENEDNIIGKKITCF